MGGEGWRTLPFDKAVIMNPPVHLERGEMYPFVDMQAVDPGSCRVGPSEHRFFKGGGSRFVHGDTLMARITPCLENGKIARYAAPDGEGAGHGSTEFIVIRGRPNVTDNEFAFYLTKWDGVRQYCISQMTGSSGRQRVPTSALSHCEVTIPPLKEQQAIGCILGTLDDKIELNRRMNKTLEEMARAIFKSWFVDFDPVRAKAAVRRAHPSWTNEQISRVACPNLKPEIAALFPDSFEDSELGEIPKGWKVGTLAEACEKPQYGFTASANNEPIGPRLLRITDINKADWIDWEAVPYCSIESSQYQKYVLRRGDIVIARMADPGHGALIEEDVDAVFASYLIRFRPKAYMFQRYLQHWLRSDFYWHLVESRQSGTTRANLNAQVLGRFAILLPPSELLEEFTRIAGALRNDLVANVHQSRTLAALRDVLLPNLISGELRVPDAERFLKEKTI